MTSISTRFTSVISVMSNSSKLSRSTQMKSAITVTQMKTAAVSHSNSFQSPAALKTNFASPVIGIKLQKRYYAGGHSSGPVSILTDERSPSQPPPYQTTYMKDMSKYDDLASRNSAYFMVGGLSVVSAMAAKNAVTDILVNMSASADVLALSKVEVGLAAIPEGKNVVLKWRGKPIFIRHRTAEEIAEANSVDMNELRDKETDSQRVQKPEWLVMIGVCTHLGCVPVGEAGEYGGWFCPCHGSHYDISGRIRKGPAPLNLEIPTYVINEETNTIVLG